MRFKAAFPTVFSVLGFILLFTPFQARSEVNAFGAPDCLKNNVGVLPVMNEQVLRWKKESKNQYKDRALIQGRSVRLIKTTKSHVHIEVQIGDGQKDQIEIIYNKEFGALPKIRGGMSIEACGEYITSREPAGGYQASPNGALIHWVHMNRKPGPGAHEDGFLVIDNVTYGFNPKAAQVPHFEFFQLPEWAAALAY
ncbi:MAG TPA: hypothetical protein DCS07_07110 [Bdellovibrionales bacterium]|nr:MAG: hypothetical protein A2Z97_07050 [Bdellovibrionales bacterium GWB1_52_6]OFZ06279.1 MAG: hypothetical protein A2X97_02335 [Bdellovibrionales bacterium GWA1_52_35]OFZ36126.1 MAG: hypothetical protein A2070_04340 [Bdellovibrionales bacterium GWC1_52_8]HAR42388.1 hypothetical protein [Bdellovibrionales bacterium]HCM40028.1 hypothetical protein [Bdellovibrionales bacterium]